jgi:ABC-type dipeptide/oligopeptide/nickel transport system permease component
MLWVFPSVIGVSLLSFFVLSLVPVEMGDDAEARALARYRFVDLPLFVNVDPHDIRSRTLAALDDLTGAEADSPEMDRAARELVRLGGAALPWLLPDLDALPSAARKRVALALAPIAHRMGLEHERAPDDPARAVVFWNRFWESHGVEFHEPTARSAVQRYARYGTEPRAAEIRRLDTFALPALIDALFEPAEPTELVPLRRLIDMIAQVTDRDDRIDQGAGLAEAAAIVSRWRRWWLAFETDYLRLSGAARAAAFLVETRYGKWVFETVVLGLGKDALGRPLLTELRERACVTLSILLVGVALAYLLGIPLGVASAHRHGTLVDRGLVAAVLIPYLLSPLVVALLAMGLGLAEPSVMWAGLLLALALVAEPTLQQRSALLAILAEDYMRAAVARGASPFRVLCLHGLRNAALPAVTRMALELPLAVTACFVLEQLFGLPGLGEATWQAVQHRDTGWLMALTLCGAVVAVLALIATDVAYGLLDPRMRHALMVQRRRRS